MFLTKSLLVAGSTPITVAVSREIAPVMTSPTVTPAVDATLNICDKENSFFAVLSSNFTPTESTKYSQLSVKSWSVFLIPSGNALRILVT